MEDADCGAGKECVSRSCRVKLPCGGDCPYGWTCQGETCVPECSSDEDCTAVEYCDEASGLCEPIDCPCGNITQHACSRYACCADRDCKAAGEKCIVHECTSGDIKAPQTGFVGDEAGIQATMN